MGEIIAPNESEKLKIPDARSLIISFVRLSTITNLSVICFDWMMISGIDEIITKALAPPAKKRAKAITISDAYE